MLFSGIGWRQGHILAQMKFAALEARVRLTDGIQLPPQTYIQAVKTKQLQAEQNYYLAWYSKQMYANGKHVMACAAVVQ